VIDAVLGRAVSNGSVLGVAAMGATPDGVVYDGAFGNANVETGAPMRNDTVFWLLSMTKAFTTTAAMQLIEQGRMHLDQPAAEILPQLAAPKVLEGFDAAGQPILRSAKRPITVRHLLTHTSGYSYSVWRRGDHPLRAGDWHAGHRHLPERCLHRAARIRAGRALAVRHLDGLGRQARRGGDRPVAGGLFPREYLRALGMKDSGFLIGGAQKRRLASFASRQPDGSLKPAPFEMPQRPEFFMGAAGRSARRATISLSCRCC
jgi:methyl acetate hydrolase